MLQQRLTYRISHDEPGFNLAQATRAPTPEQVAMPVPNDLHQPGIAPWRMVLQVTGNVIAGGALLGLLLVTPALFGLVFGVL